MAEVFSNLAHTTITNNPLSDSGTSITVATGTGARFASPTNGDYQRAFLMTEQVPGASYEIVYITARSSDTLTVTRGQDGTSAVQWASGTLLIGTPAKGTFDDLLARRAFVAQTYMGAQSVGASWESLTSNRVYAKKITLATDGLLTDIQAYLRNDAAGTDDQVESFSVAVYTDVSGTPGLLIHQSQNPTVGMLLDAASGATGDGVGRWLGLSVGRWLAAGDYWIAVSALETVNILQMAYDTGGSDRYYSSGGAWFTDWGFYTPTTSSNSYSIRAGFVASQAATEGSTLVKVIEESGASFANFTGIAGSWSSSSGIIQQTTTTGDNHARHNNMLPAGYCVFEADMRLATAGASESRMGLVCGYEGTFAGSTAIYMEGTGGAGTAVTCDRAQQLQLATQSFTWSYNTWYRMRCVIAGQAVNVYIDGVLRLVLINNGGPGDIRYLGLYAGAAAIDFRNIAVYRYLLPGEVSVHATLTDVRNEFGLDAENKPPTSANSMDDEFQDLAGQSGPTNGLASKWSWRNQASSTTTFQNGRLLLNKPASSSYSVSMLQQTISGACRWRAKMNIEAVIGNYSNVGIGFLNNADDDHTWITLGYTSGWGIEVIRGDSPTVWTSTPTSLAKVGHLAQWVYVEAENDGTNLIFKVSHTGEGYRQCHTETLATHVGTADRFFIGVNDQLNSSAGGPIGVFEWVRRLA